LVREKTNEFEMNQSFFEIYAGKLESVKGSLTSNTNLKTLSPGTAKIAME
jgi:hypothetical protein